MRNIDECILYSKDYSFVKHIKGYILNKIELHKELLKKTIKNGVEVRPNTKIVNFEFNNDGTLNSVISENGDIFTGKVFVDSSGVSGVLSKKVGLQETKLKIAVGLEYNAKYFGSQKQSHLFIGSGFKGGYGWIFPVGENRAIVGYGTFHQESITKLKEKLNLAISKKPISDLILLDNNKNFGGTIPVTTIKGRFVYKNIVCVGDSVSQVNPLVGEGYRFILQSSSIASLYIQQTIKEKNNDILKGYEVEWNKKFYDKYKKSARFRSILNFISKSDFISNLSVRFARKITDKKFERILAGDL